MQGADRRGPTAVLQSAAKMGHLRAAQANPGEHRDLIVRVAGYSDGFCDLGQALQDAGRQAF